MEYDDGVHIIFTEKLNHLKNIFVVKNAKSRPIVSSSICSSL